MTTHHQFCRERAAEALRDAEAAELDHVRERWLLAAASWERMAVRIERTQRRRAALEAEKAAAAAPVK